MFKLFSVDKSKKPDIDLTNELLDELSRFRFPLVIIQFFLIIGTLGYLMLEDYTLIEAFFQAFLYIHKYGLWCAKRASILPHYDYFHYDFNANRRGDYRILRGCGGKCHYGREANFNH